MASAFERQLMLTPPRVLGRRLRPFTLGHAHLLETSRSPFIGAGTGSKVDASDLVLAVWICGFGSWRKARAAAVSALRGNVPAGVRRWGRKIGVEFNFEQETERLLRWISDSTKSFQVLRDAEAKSVATPAAATLAVLHRAYFGTHPDRVMDLPFLDALLDVMIWHHAQGRVRAVSERQNEFFDKASQWKVPRNHKKAGRK